MRFGGALADAQVENKGETDETAVATSERFIKSLRSIRISSLLRTDGQFQNSLAMC
jgi:hypothetical protein